MSDLTGFPDLTGRRIGQYELVSILGQGGMATVYRARQPSVDREVAIKFITGQFATHPDFVARFEREARLIARLQHPHILPVYDFGREGQMLYLVMRLIEGGSLDDRLRAGPLPPAQVARLTTQIGSALTYAHEQGIVHRDLKPNNIMLDKQGFPYLMDFGIARVAQDQTRLTATGTIMGTPAYMAPEQWRGETVDARTDIYALGIMVYEMLTGALPFKGDTPYSIMYQHFDTVPLSPLQLRPDLPPGVAEVLGKALAKKPADRYNSADAFAADLAAVIDGTPRPTAPAPAGPDDRTFIATPGAAATSLPMPTAADERTFMQSAAAPSAPPAPATQPAQSREQGGRLPLIVASGAVIALLLIGGALLLGARQADQEATATQVALNATQTLIAAATQTEANRPTATHTPTSSHTPTATPTSSPTPSHTPTPTPTITPTSLPTRVLLTDYTDKALNIVFRYPQGWDVEKVQGIALFITPDFGELDFSGEIITGPPYIQIVVGSAETFGVLEMANALNAQDALVAFLGRENVQNLDPVFGTNFPAATTTRIREQFNVIRETYMLLLGPNRFASVMLQAPPDLAKDYNNRIALPLVRSLNHFAPPSPTPNYSPTPIPQPSGTFEPPKAFSTFLTPDGRIRLSYPANWLITGQSNAILASAPETAANLKLDNPNTPPYVYVSVDNARYVGYRPGKSIQDVYRDYVGGFTTDIRQIYDAPYPTAYGRTVGKPVFGIAVNGYVAVVQLGENTFLTFFAHGPRGLEQQYFDTLLEPMLRSVEYTPQPTAAPSGTARP